MHLGVWVRVHRCRRHRVRLRGYRPLSSPGETPGSSQSICKQTFYSEIFNFRGRTMNVLPLIFIQRFKYTRESALRNKYIQYVKETLSDP